MVFVDALTSCSRYKKHRQNGMVYITAHSLLWSDIDVPVVRTVIRIRPLPRLNLIICDATVYLIQFLEWQGGQ